MLDTSEAKSLAEASAKVARHYNVGINQKTQDWCNLFMALGMVYGTRLVAVSKRHKDERHKRNQPGEVIDFPGMMQPQPTETTAPAQPNPPTVN